MRFFLSDFDTVTPSSLALFRNSFFTSLYSTISGSLSNLGTNSSQRHTQVLMGYLFYSETFIAAVIIYSYKAFVAGSVVLCFT